MDALRFVICKGEGLCAGCWHRNEVEEAGIGGSGKGLGCCGTILLTYHFNQDNEYHRGGWRGVESHTVHLGLDLSGFACTLVAELFEWYDIKVNFFPVGPCVSSTAGAMFPYWLCSSFTLAGMAVAASFPR